MVTLYSIGTQQQPIAKHLSVVNVDNALYKTKTCALYNPSDKHDKYVRNSLAKCIKQNKQLYGVVTLDNQLYLTACNDFAMTMFTTVCEQQFNK